MAMEVGTVAESFMVIEIGWFVSQEVLVVLDGEIMSRMDNRGLLCEPTSSQPIDERDLFSSLRISMKKSFESKSSRAGKEASCSYLL